LNSFAIASLKNKNTSSMSIPPLQLWTRCKAYIYFKLNN
jgi:hypothetical protein